MLMVLAISSILNSSIFANLTTFLSLLLPQRKNGLFKKAYELGVLCSVDVAVIIFGAQQLIPRWQCSSNDLILFLSSTEDRPGHELKLHQYSSTDIRDVVQRQVRVRCPFPYRGALIDDYCGTASRRERHQRPG